MSTTPNGTPNTGGQQRSPPREQGEREKEVRETHDEQIKPSTDTKDKEAGPHVDRSGNE